SIEQFTKGGRDDLVAKELSEVDVLNKYKPAQLSEDQIILRVREAISTSNASSMQDIGKVMGLLKNSLSGSADMGIVSKVVKDQLS
nr:GatB/YqeY domain-containing protein [Gammaproteobacteria bacterium]